MDGDFVSLVWAEWLSLYDPGTPPPSLPSQNGIFASVTSSLQPRPDVSIAKAEIVQAAQDNTSLAARKPFALHTVLVNSNSSEVRVRIDGVVKDAGEGGTKLALTRELTLPPGEATDVYLPDSLDERKAFESLLERDGLAQVVAEAEITALDGKFDQDKTNNNQAAPICYVRQTRPIRVMFVPVQFPYREAGKVVLNDDMNPETIKGTAQNSWTYLLGAMPVPDESQSCMAVSSVPVTIERVLDTRYPKPSTVPTTEAALLRDALDARANELSRVSNQRWFVVGVAPSGLIAAMTAEDNVGISWSSRDVTLSSAVSCPLSFSAVIDGAKAGPSLATHEITHLFGWVTPDVANQQTQGGGRHWRVPAPGYWYTQGRAFTEAADDYMRARLDDQMWVSARTYAFMFRNLVGFDKDPPVLVLSGEADRQGRVKVTSSYRADGILDADLGDEGELEIVYLSDDGSELGRTGFDLEWNPVLDGVGPVAPESVSFSRQVPWVAGTHRVELRRDGIVATAIDVSASPPSVAFDGPAPGTAYSSGATIALKWTGSDPDGDSLTYSVLLSDDEGETWDVAAVDTTATSISFAAPRSLIGKSLVAKVRASDGINTAFASTDGTFTVVPAIEGIPTNRLAVEQPQILQSLGVDEPADSGVARIAASGADVYVLCPNWDYTNEGGHSEAQGPLTLWVSHDRGSHFVSRAHLRG